MPRYISIHRIGKVSKKKDSEPFYISQVFNAGEYTMSSMTPQKVFDALLVLRYRSGDKKALGLLVNRYHRKLCSHAYWYTHDINAAKDVVQDCWGVIIAKMEGLRDPNTFNSWAMRIVTRKSLDYLERNKKNREKVKAFQPSTDDLDAVEEKAHLTKKLQKGIAQLSKNQQIVLRLYYMEAYSLNEIGTILEISVGTVKSRLYHAREKLKVILKT